jgi:hypothetical protein
VEEKISEKFVLKVAKIKKKKKNGEEEKLIAKPIHIIIYAGGFEYQEYYTNYPKDEWDDLTKGKWWPTSKDFEKTALRVSQEEEKAFTKVYKAENMTDFVEAIKEQADNSVGVVSLIGHGDEGEFWFSDDQIFDLNHEGISEIKGRFTRKNAKITFYSCTTGAKEEFLQEVACKLGIRAQGFSKKLIWVVRYDLKEPHIYEDSRGLIERSKGKPVPFTDLKPNVKKKCKH